MLLFTRTTRLALALFCMQFVAAAEAQLTYPGRNTPAGTGWRATADTMIDQNRKADLDIRVEMPGGAPIQGATIDVEMLKHEFGFGSAVDARKIVSTHADYNPTYAAKVEELFNTGGFFNHLKWRAWVGDFGSGLTPAITQAGLDWYGARDIQVRGHTMMWPRYQSVPNFVRALLDIPNPTQQDLQTLYDATFNHIADIGSAVSGKVYAWDTLNEPRTSHDIEDALIGFTPSGEPTVTSRADLRARWFTAAQAADPNAIMMINDFQILPGGGLADTEPAAFKAELDQMLSNGAPVDGIGLQSHFNEDPWKAPTGPEDVWDVLDDFDSNYGLPVHITEFDFNTTDTSLQADYTRDFLTALFAHPSVETFMMWGFWEGDIGNTNSALYDTNWNIKSNGQEFIDLVFTDWWTDDSGATDSMGDYSVRGFRGEYQVSVQHNGDTFITNLTLDADGESITVVLPNLTFNTDFLGGDATQGSQWTQGLPTLTSIGRINVSGVASDFLQSVDVIQTGGTLDFTNSQTFRSAIEDSQWRLIGGIWTDSNSGIRINNSTLTVEGGEIQLGSAHQLSIGKGDVVLEITAGRVEAREAQLGTIGNFPGSKVIRLGVGDGELFLHGNAGSMAPFVFGSDGDTDNDYLDVEVGWTGVFTSRRDGAYFESLWDAGNLRRDDLKGTLLGLSFESAGFVVNSVAGGFFELRLSQIAGDFNFDGVVDLADYTVWRDGLGGDFNFEHYSIWVANYGLSAGSSSSASTSIPEPAAILAALQLGMILGCSGMPRRRSASSMIR